MLAPNAAHCLWGGAMRDACPGALLAGPPNAAARFPDLRWDALVDNPAGAQGGLPCDGVAGGGAGGGGQGRGGPGGSLRVCVK